MPPVNPTAVTSGPPIPDSSNTEATFDAQWEAFNTWVSGTLRPGMNALAADTYTNAQDVATNTATVSSAASTASTAATTATGAASTATTKAGEASASAAAAAASAAAASGAAAFLDTNPVVKGSGDATKQIRFEVDGLTTATTRVLTVPDADLTLVGTTTAQTLTNKTVVGLIEQATGSSIASSATVNLDTATGNRIHITGTTTITAVTLTHGPRTVIFDGILTLTHHATDNNLPGGANITTAAGDRAIYEGDGAAVRCIAYTKASGLPVVAGSSGALVLLATLTPTAAANLDFLTVFSSTYDNYLIIGDGITTGVTSQVQMRLAVAGTADSGSNYATFAAVGSTSSTMSTIALLSNSSTYAGGVGLNFMTTITNVNDAVRAKMISTTSAGQADAVPNYSSSLVNSTYVAANAVTGFRLLLSGGNSFAATGKIRVYGYQNA